MNRVREEAHGSAELPLGSPVLWALSALVAGLPVGFVALGLAAARCGIHARAGVALAASTVAFGAVLAWWGWLLWSAGRIALSAERPATT